MQKLVALTLTVVLGTSIRAQSSEKDVAAWTGIMLSPAGAFPAMQLAGGGKQLAFHASTWNDAGADERQNSVGVSYSAPQSSRVRYGATMGWTEPSGGGGVFLLGLDVTGDLLRRAVDAAAGSSFTADLKASLGMGNITATPGGVVWSFVGQLPLGWQYTSASKSVLSAHVTPGFALAGTTDIGSEEAATGTRPVIGAGAAWTSAGGVGLHVGTQMVPLDLGPTGESSPWVVAIGLSFRRQ